MGYNIKNQARILSTISKKEKKKRNLLFKIEKKSKKLKVFKNDWRIIF